MGTRRGCDKQICAILSGFILFILMFTIDFQLELDSDLGSPMNRGGGGRHVPTIYAVMAVLDGQTHDRFSADRIANLTKALKTAGSVHWIVVENEGNRGSNMSQILDDSGLYYTHLWTSSSGQGRNGGLKAAYCYNQALSWLRDLVQEMYLYPEDAKADGVVTFLDPFHQHYSPAFFQHIRYVHPAARWDKRELSTGGDADVTGESTTDSSTADGCFACFAIRFRQLFFHKSAYFPLNVTSESQAVQSFLAQMDLSPSRIQFRS